MENVQEQPQQSTEVGRPKVTQEIVNARFSTELTKLKYQDALQALESYKVTEDAIVEAQDKLKKARKFITQMEDIKAVGKEPALIEGRYWDAALKSFLLPLQTALDTKAADIQKISTEMAARKKKEEDENKRKEDIQTAINTFILDQSKAIAEAKSDDTLISIEKLIGSHKANKSRYQEFLPDLIERCNDLTHILKGQKESIRSMEELKKQQAEAVTNGDDAKVLELEEKKEALSDKIDEAKVIVQEKAIEGATRSSGVSSGVTQIFSAPKARRTTWGMEIVDEKKAFAAGMLICVIDKEKGKTQLAAIKATLPEDQTEVIINGVRYYESKTY